SMTVLLPARHEEQVIFQTVSNIAAVDYPRDLLDLIIICHEDDQGTVAEAERAARTFSGPGKPAIHVQTFSGFPINKPRALNVGLAAAAGEVITVFDAEDDVSPDLLLAVNNIMTSERCAIVQGPVQLMNHSDRWYSIHNAMEYYFYYKSRLSYFAQSGVMPLAGITVFICRV